MASRYKLCLLAQNADEQRLDRKSIFAKHSQPYPPGLEQHADEQPLDLKSTVAKLGRSCTPGLASDFETAMAQGDSASIGTTIADAAQSLGEAMSLGPASLSPIAAAIYAAGAAAHAISEEFLSGGSGSESEAPQEDDVVLQGSSEAMQDFSAKFSLSRKPSLAKREGAKASSKKDAGTSKPSAAEVLLPSGQTNARSPNKKPSLLERRSQPSVLTIGSSTTSTASELIQQKHLTIRGPSLLSRRGLHGDKIPSTLHIPKRNCDKTGDSMPEMQLEDQFSCLKQLGMGSSSTVWRGTRTSDGRTVALKVMRSRDDEMVRIAKREFEMMRSLVHPNIVKVLDFCVFAGQAVLVLDYMHGQTLSDVIRGLMLRSASRNQKSCGLVLPELPAGRGLARQLLEAVEYMHRNEILHRDIKPENILISERLDGLRLVDFNTSTYTCDSFTPAGTMLYMAPEVISGEASMPSSDVWGAFLCIFFMLSGRLPQKRDQVELCRSSLEMVAKRKVRMNESCWEHASEPCKLLLKRGLSVKCTDRPAANEALLDPWLAPENGSSFANRCTPTVS